MDNIRIKSLSMTNWRCFKFKTVTFDEGFNFYNNPNGWGKTSIFYAILYCLYGVLPANTDQLKNEIDKPIILELNFVNNTSGNTFSIKKELVSATIKKYYIRPELNTDYVKVSVKQMDEFVDAFAGRKDIFPLIWCQDTISNSSVLSINYIKEKIFNDEFEEADKLISMVKEDRGFLLKQEKSLVALVGEDSKIEDVESDIETTKKKIAEIEAEIKENPYKKSGMIDKALRCIEARKKLNTIDITTFTLYDKIQISRYQMLKMKESKNLQVIANYTPKNEELEEFVRIFNNSMLKSIINDNADSCQCPVCQSNFSFEDKFEITRDEMIKQLFSSGTSNNVGLFNTAQREIEELSEFDPDSIKLSEEYYSTKALAESVEDPEELIEREKKANDDLWKFLEEEKRKLELYIKKIENINKLIEVRELKSKDGAILTAIETWKNEKTNNIISYLLNETSKKMSQADQKYLGVYYSVEEKAFQVAMMKNDNMLVLHQELLSSGEKSVLALALILSYRDLLKEKKHIPSFFMLDESLSSLDNDHLNKCIEMLKRSDHQTLLINHQ